MPDCCECHRQLTADEIGATRKLINRGATEFRCLSCLAKDFQVPEALLREKIEEWRGYGCSLFPPKRDAGAKI